MPGVVHIALEVPDVGGALGLRLGCRIPGAADELVAARREVDPLLTLVGLKLIYYKNRG